MWNGLNSIRPSYFGTAKNIHYAHKRLKTSNKILKINSINFRKIPSPIYVFFEICTTCLRERDYKNSNNNNEIYLF